MSCFPKHGRGLALLFLFSLAGCLGAIPMDRQKAADYQRRYSTYCRPRAREERLATQTPAGGRAKGTLSKQLIRQRVDASIHDVRNCYEEALAAWPELSGRIDIKFVISSDGSVWDAAPINNSTGVAALGCCIVRAVRTWDFPPPDNGGIVIVEYPFVLELL